MSAWLSFVLAVIRVSTVSAWTSLLFIDNRKSKSRDEEAMGDASLSECRSEAHVHLQDHSPFPDAVRTR